MLELLAAVCNRPERLVPIFKHYNKVLVPILSITILIQCSYKSISSNPPYDK
ncbi:hypothetical protein T492DRAFT_929234 [Pavlovales sp. CCMP2436]|nr:hypothetical protein T492DRAFT_929234 [Pavlovales sp. CCMP2436]